MPRKATVRGIRAIEIEFADCERAARFFIDVWHLSEVVRAGPSICLRGTGRYHHILALHPADTGPCVRRIVFEAMDAAAVDALFEQVSAATGEVERPHELDRPGGGYGFGFADFEGRNYAVICGCADHPLQTEQKDRPSKITHINLNTPDVAQTVAFFETALGFRFIDQSGPLTFLHCDTPDHSSMVVCAAARPTLNHIAFELPDWESVMRGAGRMRDAGYPLEWGPGRHSAGNNVFGYFAGPEELPLEYTAEVLQIDDSYVPHGPDYWRFPPGRLDQWGMSPPHTLRWKRIQDLYPFRRGGFAI